MAWTVRISLGLRPYFTSSRPDTITVEIVTQLFLLSNIKDLLMSNFHEIHNKIRENILLGVTTAFVAYSRSVQWLGVPRPRCEKSYFVTMHKD